VTFVPIIIIIIIIIIVIIGCEPPLQPYYRARAPL
jgi:hypothetical protein